MMTYPKLQTIKGQSVVLRSGTNVRNPVVTIQVKADGAVVAITGYTIKAALFKKDRTVNKAMLTAAVMSCTVTDGVNGTFTIPFDVTEITGPEEDAYLYIYRIDASSKIVPMLEFTVDVVASPMTA